MKWSDYAANYREKKLEKSREALRSRISTSLEEIRLDLYVTAMVDFNDAKLIVRTPFSFSANVF